MLCVKIKNNLSEGVQIYFFVLKAFLVDEGTEYPNTTISWTSSAESARQQNAFRWRAHDDPTMNVGFVAL